MTESLLKETIRQNKVDKSKKREEREKKKKEIILNFCVFISILSSFCDLKFWMGFSQSLIVIGLVPHPLRTITSFHLKCVKAN